MIGFCAREASMKPPHDSMPDNFGCFDRLVYYGAWPILKLLDGILSTVCAIFGHDIDPVDGWCDRCDAKPKTEK